MPDRAESLEAEERSRGLAAIAGTEAEDCKMMIATIYFIKKGQPLGLPQRTNFYK